MLIGFLRSASSESLSVFAFCERPSGPKRDSSCKVGSCSLPPEPSGHDAEAEHANSHQLNSEIGLEPWIAERVTELARDGRNRKTPRDDQKAEHRGRSPASVKASD